MPRLTTRDYKRPSRSAGVSKLREFGFGVLVGAVLASAAFLIAGSRARHQAASHAHAAAGSQSAAPHAPAPEEGSSNDPDATSGPTSAASSQTASARPGSQAPQYDFYRMLPRLNVPVPRDDARPSHAPPPAPDPPPHGAGAATGPAYLVQVGSYRSSAEADQVRARLARAGISAQVERVAEGSRTWNRVRIGPLSEEELARVREQLRTANLHALVIRANR